MASLLVVPLACMAQAQSIVKPGPTNYSVQPTLGAAIPGDDGNREKLMDRLQLDKGQSEFWYKFEARLDAYSKLFYEEKPPAAYASDTAPRQFARLTDSFQNRLAALEEIEEAAKDLYAVLNADQQKIASQSLLSTVPTFVSAANCVPTDTKARTDKRDATQRSRRGGATGSGLGGPG